MFPLEEIRTQLHSLPRNPSLIRFFRYAKLGENAGFGIDKMLTWEKLTGKNVEFKSDLVCSTVTYWFSGQAGGQASGQVSEQVSEQVQILVNAIRENVYSMFDIQSRLNISSRRYVLVEMLTPAIEQGYVLRAYPDKPRHPKQRYYLSEKGLKLVK